MVHNEWWLLTGPFSPGNDRNVGESGKAGPKWFSADCCPWLNYSGNFNSRHNPDVATSPGTIQKRLLADWRRSAAMKKGDRERGGRLEDWGDEG